MRRPVLLPLRDPSQRQIRFLLFLRLGFSMSSVFSVFSVLKFFLSSFNTENTEKT
jgi:hypothetical protein